MTIHAVRLRRNSDYEDRDPFCYVYQRDGDLYHAHKHPGSGWNEGRFYLSNLEHHLTTYHKDTFYPDGSLQKLPDYVKERLSNPPGEADS